jgi:hypothetical protein
MRAQKIAPLLLPHIHLYGRNFLRPHGLPAIILLFTLYFLLAPTGRRAAPFILSQTPHFW